MPNDPNGALAISHMPVPRFPAMLALMACPGSRALPAGHEAVRRSFRRDVERLAALDVALVLSCLTAEELPLCRSEAAHVFSTAGVAWRLLPIADMSAPDPALDGQLQELLGLAESYLRRGQQVAIHCKAGLGRTGTVAARLLIRQGLTAETAIAAVRAAHDEAAIETAAQIAYLERSAGARPLCDQDD